MSKLPHNLLLTSIVFCLALPLAIRVDADVIYLASWRDMLYRTTDGGSVETFDFERAIRAMHRDLATGEVWVLADNYWPIPDHSRLYRLHNPFSGTPSWTEYAVMPRQYGGLTRVAETWYAVSSGDLYTLDLNDPANPVEQYVGSFGLQYTGGLGYDPVTETLYLIARNTDNALYTLDPETADLSRIGDTGIESAGWGAEWSGGQLFTAVQNTSSGSFEIGTIDVTTGLYSPMMTLGDADRVATALTMIPEPTVPASLDVKPGSCPNPLNRNSRGVVPVAVVGTADFDVTQIEPNSLVLTRGDGVGGAVSPLMGPPGPGIRVEDVATPFEGEPCDCHELEGDGIDDLSMKFDTEVVVSELQLNDLPGGVWLELVVSGELSDGTRFSATDCVRLVPPGPGSGLARPGSDVGDSGPDVPRKSRPVMPHESISGSDSSRQDAEVDRLIRPPASEADDAGTDEDEDVQGSFAEPSVGCGPVSPAFLLGTIAAMWLSRRC